MENFKIILSVIAMSSSVIGSVSLALRVKNILDALKYSVEMHENNIKQILSKDDSIFIAINSTDHVKRAKGTGLLVFGFLCLGLSGLSNILLVFLK